ncbi:HAD family hydrolase [Streptomyces sp. NPDC048594]|uniref:HAD family hydrolase n=1 Tax=Streptomyces sp. NPDC048594 TaxID=3365575 RepID=UPI00371543D8
MTAAVLFDYGGVLTPSGTAGSHAAMLSAQLGVPIAAESIEDLHRDFRVDAISAGAFVAAVHARVPERRRDLDEHTWPWPGLLRRHQRIYDLAFRLRKHGIRTGILSNVWLPIARSLARAGSYDGFDPLVLSCEAGCAKPDPAIYHLALERLGLAAGDVLFVDDQPRHLAAAAGVGMQTLLATGEAQVVRDLATRLALDMFGAPLEHDPHETPFDLDRRGTSLREAE